MLFIGVCWICIMLYVDQHRIRIMWYVGYIRISYIAYVYWSTPLLAHHIIFCNKKELINNVDNTVNR